MPNPYLGASTQLKVGDDFPTPELVALTVALHERELIPSALWPRPELERLSKPERISVPEMQRFQAVTGLSRAAAREFLQECPPESYGRFMAATALARRKNERGLRDPCEYHPRFEELLTKVRSEARELLEGEERARDFCLRIWGIMKQILREKHRVEWFTPAEMNPWIKFA